MIIKIILLLFSIFGVLVSVLSLSAPNGVEWKGVLGGVIISVVCLGHYYNIQRIDREVKRNAEEDL